MKRNAETELKQQVAKRFELSREEGDHRAASPGVALDYDGPEWEMPYAPLGPERPDKQVKKARLAKLDTNLVAQLMRLPEEVTKEYLGPNFDFSNDNLEAFQTGSAVSNFSRIVHLPEDIPDIVVQLHPHLFISAEKFKQLAAFAYNRSDDPASFSQNAWNRIALCEAAPFKAKREEVEIEERDENGELVMEINEKGLKSPKKSMKIVTRGVFCKRQLRQLDAEMAKLPLSDFARRRATWSKYEEDKFRDSKTFTSLKQLNYLASKVFLRSEWDVFSKQANREHLTDLHRAGLGDLRALWKYNMSSACKKIYPEVLVRKSDQTFISGELMQQSRWLLRADLFELHTADQVQLMSHYPSGDPTGEYKSLFTHAEGNFRAPSPEQSGQLGLRLDHQYKKRSAYESRLEHEKHFADSLLPGPGVDTKREQNHPGFMFRQMNFEALLQSEYHKVRTAIALIQDPRPLDRERFMKIKDLLNLDANLQHSRTQLDRPRDRTSGRA